MFFIMMAAPQLSTFTLATQLFLFLANNMKTE